MILNTLKSALELCKRQTDIIEQHYHDMKQIVWRYTGLDAQPVNQDEAMKQYLEGLKEPEENFINDDNLRSLIQGGELTH